jgi:TrmH family RNA methyltransferase
MNVIRSRDNPRVKRWVKLASDSGFRRKEGRVLIEGPHLVAEALQAGIEPITLIASETGLKRNEVQELLGRREPVVLGDRLFGVVADAETPPGIAAEIAIPRPLDAGSKAAVFLEGIQDPANVGAILRSAAAFGVGEVLHDAACADPWSPKVLRAAMGGHFKLALRQVSDLVTPLEEFQGATVCTVSSGGTSLKDLELRGRIGWIFGSEGRGVSPALAAKARLQATIPMAAGSESLNVAAAAAICLYEGYLKNQTPRSPSAHAPLHRGAA